MTEASRVQKMLNEQNAWIDQLKSEVMRLNLELVGYKVRNTQLEAALREIVGIHPFKDPEGDVSIKSLVDLVFSINMTARKALDDAP
jgi:hypothetical protein